jgi:hypothetical protein
MIIIRSLFQSCSLRFLFFSFLFFLCLLKISGFVKLELILALNMLTLHVFMSWIVLVVFQL